MAKKAREFSAKDRVAHQKFGTGTIVDIDAHHTTILFDETGQRKFITSMVKLAPSDTPPPAKPVRKKKVAKKKATKAAKAPKKTTKAAATKTVKKK